MAGWHRSLSAMSQLCGADGHAAAHDGQRRVSRANPAYRRNTAIAMYWHVAPAQTKA
jgi:hypothetical protein